jgi:Protein of unknown function (DUF2442)
MSSSTAKLEPVAVHMDIDDAFLRLRLADGRELAVPLAWYPKLSAATEEQRKTWRWIGGGIGVHWPDLDEDLSIRGMLMGNSAA